MKVGITAIQWRLTSIILQKGSKSKNMWSTLYLDVLPAVRAVAEVTTRRRTEVKVLVLRIATDGTRLLAKTSGRDTETQRREHVSKGVQQASSPLQKHTKKGTCVVGCSSSQSSPIYISTEKGTRVEGCSASQSPPIYIYIYKHRDGNMCRRVFSKPVAPVTHDAHSRRRSLL